MCQLLSPEGDPLGSALYLPQNVGPPQLQEIVNQLLHNVLLCSNCFLSHLSNSFILPCFPQPYLSILLLLTHSCCRAFYSFRRRNCPMHSTLETRSSLSTWVLTCGRRTVRWDHSAVHLLRCAFPFGLLIFYERWTVSSVLPSNSYFHLFLFFPFLNSSQCWGYSAHSMPTTSTFPDQAGQPMLCHDCWYVSRPVVLLIIPPSYYFGAQLFICLSHPVNSIISCSTLTFLLGVFGCRPQHATARPCPNLWHV
jgi:hypothetical protein